MNSKPTTRKARCLAAIQGEGVDRAPRYLPGIACDVASRILGRCVHTGTGSLHYAETCALVKGEAAHAEFVHELFENLAGLNRMLDIDVFRMPWRQTIRPAKQLDDFTFVFGDPEGDHTISRYMPETGDFGPIKRVKKRPTPDDPVKVLQSSVESAKRRIDAGELKHVDISAEHRHLCETYGDEFFVVCNGGGIAIGYNEDMMAALILAPDLVRELLMLQAERALALARALARTPYARVLIGGGDMAGNDGPFFSPESFRTVFLPALEYMMKGMRELDVHYVFRSDGNLWPIADMLFGEAHCPGYGEVDRDASMTLENLRQRYPELVIWNNMSCNKLHLRSAEWVREESLRCVEESAGTRYFHGSSNAIMKGTPAENVLAMFSI